MDHSICPTVSNYAGFYSAACVSNSHRAVAYIVFLLTTGVLFSASEVTTLSRYTNTFIIIISSSSSIIILTPVLNSQSMSFSGHGLLAHEPSRKARRD